MRTSLIVTTYNWPEALVLTLASIARQRRLPDEVVVADDGSAAPTAECIQRLAAGFPVPLRHAWQDDRGFRAARVRNLAAAMSRHEYLIYTDGDMVLHPMFVADHLALARRGSWLQGGRLNASPRETQRLLAGGRPRFSPLIPLVAHRPGELRREHALRLPWLARRRSDRDRGGTVMSCNMSLWRADLERVNGFDEAFEGWGHEDAELAERLGHAGVRRRAIRFAGSAVHLWHRTRCPEDAGCTPNDARLRRTIEQRLTRCEMGLDGHRTPAAVREASLAEA